VLVTWEDFTEKRKAQELLQHNMMLLRKTQTIAKMSGWSYDLDSRKFQVADDALGFPATDLTESTEADLTKLIHPDDYDRVKLAWGKAISGEIVEFENRLCIDGNVFWVSVRAEPQQDESGRLIKILGVAQDITDKKRLEAQVIQAQKYEGIGVLAGGIAHEFNNILTSVLGNAELGLMQSPAESPATPIFGEIGKAARRAAALTKQMLAYSGRGQMQLAPMQLSAIVQDAALVLHSMAEGQQAELVFKLGPSAAVGDAIQLRLVVLQLVSNAVEALESKAGKVVITTGEITLTEADLNQEFALPPIDFGDYSVLEVSDNGCGMSAEVVGKIFDPFFSTKFAGRGLGLAAVLGIVKRHKGAMQVRTAPGAGSTIRVLFPQVLSPPDSSIEQPPSSAAAKPQCVLLVEDELTVREFLTQLLLGAGYQVIAASNGAEGIELAKQHRSQIQLVLLDVLMPKVDGWAACGPLRQILPNTPIIFMSGYGETAESESRLKAMSPSAFLAKPFRPSQLFAVMKQALTAAVKS
jgi:two-component system, cell cycle sensor histidine kinase and response regulator CckA